MEIAKKVEQILFNPTNSLTSAIEEHQIMPDFSNCKVIQGNLCCWDKEKNEFFIVEQKRIFDRELYKEAVAAFINDNAKNKEQ